MVVAPVPAVAAVQLPVTTRISVGPAGRQGDGFSDVPAMSADGTSVAFGSYAANLVSGDTNGTGDVFVRDRRSSATSRVSVSSTGEQSNGFSGGHATISADGPYVAFSELLLCWIVRRSEQ